jgi:glycosyltransferase involved in cell wall biosynthesis
MLSLLYTHKERLFFFFFILVACLSPVLAAFIYWFPEHSFFLAGKDMLIIVFFVLALVYWKSSGSFPYPLAVFLFFVVYALGALLLSDASLGTRFGSLRQLFMPIILLFIGYAVSNGKNLLELNAKLMYHFLWVVTLIGFIVYFLPARFLLWIKPYFEAKGTDISEMDLPAQWVEPVYDGIPRMVSVFFDPINYGHFLVFALFFLLPQLRFKLTWVLYLLQIVALVLTFCKGAWLQTLILLGILYLPFPRMLKVVGIFLIPLAIYWAAGFHAGIANHQTGVENAFNSLSLLGYGLGTTGNVAVIFGSAKGPEIFDTYVGSLIGQLGLLGFVFWIMGWLVAIIGLNRSSSLLSWILISQLIVSIYSENAFNLLSIWGICLFAGMELSRSLEKNNRIAISDPVGQKAGMDYFSSQLASALAKTGFSVSVYSNFSGGKNFIVYNVYVEKKDSKIEKIKSYLIGNTLMILKTLRHKEHDLIFHSFKTTLKESIVLLKARLLRYRIHLLVHDVEGFDKNDSIILKRWVMKSLATHVYTLNAQSREILSRMVNLPAEQILLIRHGHFLDLPDSKVRMKAARQKLALDQKEFYFLFFGQIKPVKALDIAIEALSKLKSGKLIIAGKVRADDYQTYQKLIEKYNLQNRVITHIRYISNEERELFFKASNVVLIPYRKIFQSGVLLMALSYRKIVIASDLEPNKEVIVHNKTGYLFKSESSSDLADKMNWAMANPTQQQNMVVEAVKHLKINFNWDISAQVIRKNYLQA